MAEKITYYAIIDEFSSREQPAGVLRRIKHDEGERDEMFARDLIWARSSLLYSAERGDLRTSSCRSVKRKLAGSWRGFGG